MKITDIPFAALRFQYHFVRFPLQLIEERVFARMGEEVPARLFYERSLGVLDRAVGNALGDPELAQRGSALAERSDALGRAARLDAAAARKQEHADGELIARREQAIDDEQEAHAAKEREIAQAHSTADAQKDAAADAAKNRTAAVKEQADERASRLLEAAEAAKRNERAASRAAEQKATAAAGSKLEDAQISRSVAAGKRAQADRVEKLADAERWKRQSERAKDNA
jgi:hypothetical protein